MTDGVAPRLRVRDLSVFYGKICAVRSLSIDVCPGEIVALIGPNSAGKTSTLLSIASRSPSRRTNGDVEIDGDRVSDLATAARLARGVRLVPQGREVFPTLTVEDNLRVIADHLGVEWQEALAQSRVLFPHVFVQRARSLAGNLSGGEQQMLALARALLGKPQVLLLDEPSLGLARGVVSELARVIRDLRGQGMAILLADQSVTPWKDVAERICVMVRGSIIATVDHAGEVDRLLGVG
jgi:branched-chain amino acid transport system ATP-binding protein